MAYAPSQNPENPDDFPEVPIERPITAIKLAKQFNVYLFEIISDLVSIQHYSGISQDIPDDIVFKLGLKRRIFFKIINAA